MAVRKPRNRTLIFRLTQDEYGALQNASSDEGARSLSEFARAKLLGAITRAPLDSQITELHTSVVRLTQLLERQ